MSSQTTTRKPPMVIGAKPQINGESIEGSRQLGSEKGADSPEPWSDVNVSVQSIPSQDSSSESGSSANDVAYNYASETSTTSMDKATLPSTTSGRRQNNRQPPKRKRKSTLSRPNKRSYNKALYQRKDSPIITHSDLIEYSPDMGLQRRYRKHLKQHGILEFLSKFIPASVTRSDICKLTLDLGYPKEAIERFESLTAKKVAQILMGLLVNDKTLSDPSLPNFRSNYTIEKFLGQLRTAKNIILITGAGISTSLGIPDFRSFKGLYSQLKHLELKDPQNSFNLETFKTNPNIFYSIAHLILPPEDKFSIFHSFVKLLQDKNKLLRNYTQNIDNLETRVGISKEKLIQCHGSFGHATCLTCNDKFAGHKIFDHIKHKQVPRCLNCYKKIEMDEEVAINYGVIKPDITFFGEDLPNNYHRAIKSDVSKCDLVIVIGSSLSVEPVGSIIDQLPSAVPRVLMNMDDLPLRNFDLRLLGKCDDIASYIGKSMGAEWDIPNSLYNRDNSIKMYRDPEDKRIYRAKE